MAASESEEQPAPEQHLGVLVRNVSDVSAADLVDAERECANLFAHAGVRILWINASQDLVWEGPALVVRAAILPRPPVPRRLNVLGSSVLRETGGLQLFLFYDRVEQLGRSAQLPVHTVLAGALAHEIGHVLLRSEKHSQAGIMRAEWSGEQLRELGQGLLEFTADQKRTIRSHIKARRIAKQRGAVAASE
jgi:hypothetical protein